MFDSKSPVSKITSYIVIGFFAIVILISFGMSDITTQLGTDKSTAAIVNGKKIHIYDYLHFRDTRYGRSTDKRMQQFIFNQFLGRYLIVQESDNIGFTITEPRISRTIKGFDAFKTGGRYDAEKLKNYLKSNKYSLSELYKDLKYDLLNSDYLNAMRMGLAVDRADVMEEYRAAHSTFSIKVAKLPESELRKRLTVAISVTDKEIDEALKKEKELKDPKSDRERVKRKLESAKYAAARKTFLASIKKMRKDGRSFQAILSTFKGKVELSKNFTPGENIQFMKKRVIMPGLSKSPLFTSQLISLAPDKPSSVIEASRNLYIFAVVSKKIADPAKAESKEIAAVEKNLEKTSFSSLYSRYMRNLFEKSKITKLLKN